MVAISQMSSLDYAKSELGLLSAKNDLSGLSKTIQVVHSHIERYLSTVDRNAVSIRYFTHLIKQELDRVKQKDSIFPRYISNARKIINCLKLCENKLRKMELFADLGNPNFEQYIQCHSVKRLLKCAHDPEENLSETQAEVLFEWAGRFEYFHILRKMLTYYDPPHGQLIRLVKKSLAINRFRAIAFPIMVYHLNGLPVEVQNQIKTWVHSLENPTSFAERPAAYKVSCSEFKVPKAPPKPQSLGGNSPFNLAPIFLREQPDSTQARQNNETAYGWSSTVL